MFLFRLVACVCFATACSDLKGEGEKYDNNNGEKGGNNGTNREEHDKELQPTKSMSVPSKELDAARLVPQRSLSMQRGLFGFLRFVVSFSVCRV